MAPKRWGTLLQILFIRGYLVAYDKACKGTKKDLTRFWPILEEDWFTEFPLLPELVERELLPPHVLEPEFKWVKDSPEEKAYQDNLTKRKNQLKTLIRYEYKQWAAKAGIAISDPSRVAISTAAKSFVKPQRRSFQPAEMYYRLYKSEIDDLFEKEKDDYDDEVGEVKEEEAEVDVVGIAAEGVDGVTADGKEGAKGEKPRIRRRGWNLRLRRKIFTREWKNTTDERKAIVYEEMEKHKTQLVLEADLDQTGRGLARDGALRLSSLQRVNAFWASNAQSCWENAALMSVQIGIAPDPEHGDKLVSFSICYGLDPDGKLFHDVFPNFNDYYVKPILNWAKANVFTPAAWEKAKAEAAKARADAEAKKAEPPTQDGTPNDEDTQAEIFPEDDIETTNAGDSEAIVNAEPKAHTQRDKGSTDSGKTDGDKRGLPQRIGEVGNIGGAQGGLDDDDDLELPDDDEGLAFDVIHGLSPPNQGGDDEDDDVETGGVVVSPRGNSASTGAAQSGVDPQGSSLPTTHTTQSTPSLPKHPNATHPLHPTPAYLPHSAPTHPSHSIPVHPQWIATHPPQLAPPIPYQAPHGTIPSVFGSYFGPLPPAPPKHAPPATASTTRPHDPNDGPNEPVELGILRALETSNRSQYIQPPALDSASQPHAPIPLQHTSVLTGRMGTLFSFASTQGNSISFTPKLTTNPATSPETPAPTGQASAAAALVLASLASKAHGKPTPSAVPSQQNPPLPPKSFFAPSPAIPSSPAKPTLPPTMSNMLPHPPQAPPTASAPATTTPPTVTSPVPTTLPPTPAMTTLPLMSRAMVSMTPPLASTAPTTLGAAQLNPLTASVAAPPAPTLSFQTNIPAPPPGKTAQKKTAPKGAAQKKKPGPKSKKAPAKGSGKDSHGMVEGSGEVSQGKSRKRKVLEPPAESEPVAEEGRGKRVRTATKKYDEYLNASEAVRGAPRSRSTK